MHRNLLVSVLLVIALVSPSGYTQDAAPPIDYEPLEPPRPIAASGISDAGKVLSVVSAQLEKAGFAIHRKDRRAFTVEGRRYNPSHPKDYDRIILWLSRSAADANDVEVYLLYGRYVEIFGNRKRIERIAMSVDDQEQIVGKVTQDLAKAVTSIQGEGP